MDVNYDNYINSIIEDACDYIEDTEFEFEEDIDINPQVRGYEK